MKRKRILVAILSGVMILTIPETSSATVLKKYGDTIQISEEVTNISYAFDKSTGTLTIKGSGVMPYEPYREGGCHYCIYNTWEDRDLYVNDVKNVVVEEGITSIAGTTFADMENLQSISLPSTIKQIDEYAFANCKSLKSIDLPDSLVTIGEEAFYNCISLESISFGKNFKNFGSYSLRNCTALKNIYVNSYNPYYVVVHNGLYSKDKTNLYAYAVKANDSIQLENTTQKIFDFAFNGSNAASITIPASVENIYGVAFANCKKLTSVIFAKDSKLIDIDAFQQYYGDDVDDCVGAFDSCTSLKGIIFPNSLKRLNTVSFQNCTNFESISLGKSFEEFYDTYTTHANFNAKTNPKLKKITVSASNTKYVTVSGVLYTKNKKSVCMYPRNRAGSTYKVDKKAVKVANNAFEYNNNLKKISLSTKLAMIGTNAFNASKSLQIISGSKSINDINENAFYNCKKLKSISIKGKKAVIRQHAFYNCKSLTMVTMPKIQKICREAFFGCTNYKKVKLPTTVTYLGDECFGCYEKADYNIGKIKGIKIYGKKGSKAYKYAKKNKIVFVRV